MKQQLSRVPFGSSWHLRKFWETMKSRREKFYTMRPASVFSLLEKVGKDQQNASETASFA